MNRSWAVQLTEVCDEASNLISCVSYHVSVWRNSGICNYTLLFIYLFEDLGLFLLWQAKIVMHSSKESR